MHIKQPNQARSRIIGFLEDSIKEINARMKSLDQHKISITDQIDSILEKGANQISCGKIPIAAGKIYYRTTERGQVKKEHNLTFPKEPSYSNPITAFWGYPHTASEWSYFNFEDSEGKKALSTDKSWKEWKFDPDNVGKIEMLLRQNDQQICKM